MVFMHVKACDSFGHDGDFDGKTGMVKKIDAALPILEKTGACIVITADLDAMLAQGAFRPFGPILVYRRSPWMM